MTYRIISNRFGSLTSAETLERAIKLAKQHKRPDEIITVWKGQEKVYEV